MDSINRENVETEITEKTYCANHPKVETLLRCNRCGKLICMRCSERTSVGYRCTECIRGVQSNYFNAEGKDNPIAFVISFIITAISAPIVSTILAPFFIWGFLIAFMVGSGAGGLLTQIIRRAIGKRRGRYLRYFVIGGIILGALVGNVVALFLPILNPFSLPMLIFVFLAASTSYGFMR